MNGKLVFILSLFVLFASLMYVRFNPVEVKSSNGFPVQNLDTGLNYTTIQEAIDANETLDGHTIFVENGTYYEHVAVNKSLSLIGENRSNTIIDGNLTGTVMNVTVGNVNITGFTVQNSGFHPYCGIYVSSGGNNISYNIITANNWYGVILKESSNNDISGNIIKNNTYCGIWLNSSNTNTVSGNNITDNRYGGIYFKCSSSNSISGNNITDTWFGIHLYESSNNSISGNEIIANNDTSIWLDYSSNNTMSRNNITDNQCGFRLWGSSNNTISANYITNNDDGITLDYSSNNTLSGNVLNGNTYSFGVWGDRLREFMHSIDVSNLINGKPVYYLVNQKDLLINPTTYPDIGYLAIINSVNVTIEGLTLKNNWQGLLLANANNSRITDNNMTNNRWGILLWRSSFNTVSGNNINNEIGGLFLDLSDNNIVCENNIINNGYAGIRLWWSFNNIVSENNVANNEECGISLGGPHDYPFYNSVFGNNVTNNEVGIELDYGLNNGIFTNNVKDNEVGISLIGASNNSIFQNNISNNNRYGVLLDSSRIYVINNRFYHNNFINNTQQMYYKTSSHANFWDNGVEGNYWSNYTGVDFDHDGIGDSWHEINENNTDHYPLMGMFSSFNTSLGKHVNVISNSTIEDFTYSVSNNTIRLHVSNMTTNQTYGFCRVCIPKDLMAPPYNVTINNGAIEVLHFNDTICDNGTHTWIYFAYEHSTREIDIIPEFPSLIILPLFMVATLLAVIVCRRVKYSDKKASYCKIL